MPPRYAYWTILVDNLPTAFRSSSQEELMPTFNRLKEKNPSAEMKWWQNGKLWDSRVDAQEAMIARGELGRKGDVRQRDGDRRQGGGFRDRSRPRPSFDKPREEREERDASGKLGWKPKGDFTPAPPAGSKPEWKPKDKEFSSPQALKPSSPGRAQRDGGWKPKSSFGSDRPRRDAKPEWKPKGEFTPAPPKSEWKPKRSFGSDRSAKPDWKSKPRSDRPHRDEKPDWKPKGSFKTDRPARAEWKSKSSDDRPRRSEKPDWKPKGSFTADRPSKPDWKSKPRGDRPRRSERPEWKPKGDAPSAPGEKRKWVPKEEYKKSLGIEAKRDKNWRPGGAHKDPRQKYKDAKKAKWGRFKEGIRKRWESKGAKPRKKKDDE